MMQNECFPGNKPGFHVAAGFNFIRIHSGVITCAEKNRAPSLNRIRGFLQIALPSRVYLDQKNKLISQLTPNPAQMACTNMPKVDVVSVSRPLRIPNVGNSEACVVRSIDNRPVSFTGDFWIHEPCNFKKPSLAPFLSQA